MRWANKRRPCHELERHEQCDRTYSKKSLTEPSSVGYYRLYKDSGMTNSIASDLRVGNDRGLLDATSVDSVSVSTIGYPCVI